MLTTCTDILNTIYSLSSIKGKPSFLMKRLLFLSILFTSFAINKNVFSHEHTNPPLMPNLKESERRELFFKELDSKSTQELLEMRCVNQLTRSYKYFNKYSFDPKLITYCECFTEAVIKNIPPKECRIKMYPMPEDKS